MTEKNLDSLLARFPNLLIEGLREDIGKKPKLGLNATEKRWQASTFGTTFASASGPKEERFFRTEASVL